MATTRANRQVYADLLARYGVAVADAFFRALDNLRAGVELQRVTAALQNGDIDAALEALHIDPAAFNEMADRIRDAHTEGGRAAVDGMPKRRPGGTALVIRFDGRNPEAERWLSQYSSDLIRRMTDDQKDAARKAMAAGMAEGKNPRQTALDIVGRISRASGKRTGGILGLTSAQVDHVVKARSELESGRPNALNHYLTRKARDRRYDRSVLKAIREGKPVPPETAANAVRAYEQRLLKLRGETIARTETMSAMARSSFEAYRQAIEAGKIDASAVTKIWSSASDFRVRHSHRTMDGQKVGFFEPFRSPSGAQMMHPMDRSLGAGTDEILNCRCVCTYRIDFLANLR